MACTSSTLNLSELLAADAERPYEVVDVPEWGGAVVVAELGAWERSEVDRRFFESLPKPDEAAGGPVDDPDTSDYPFWLVAASLRSGPGNRPLTQPDQWGQVAQALEAKSAAPFGRVYEAVARLNKLRREDRDQGKGSSDSSPDDASP